MTGLPLGKNIAREISSILLGKKIVFYQLVDYSKVQIWVNDEETASLT